MFIHPRKEIREIRDQSRDNEIICLYYWADIAVCFDFYKRLVWQVVATQICLFLAARLKNIGSWRLDSGTWANIRQSLARWLPISQPYISQAQLQWHPEDRSIGSWRASVWLQANIQEQFQMHLLWKLNWATRGLHRLCNPWRLCMNLVFKVLTVIPTGIWNHLLCLYSVAREERYIMVFCLTLNTSPFYHFHTQIPILQNDFKTTNHVYIRREVHALHKIPRPH